MGLLVGADHIRRGAEMIPTRTGMTDRLPVNFLPGAAGGPGWAQIAILALSRGNDTDGNL